MNSRISNYFSHIRQRKRTCEIVNHFIDNHMDTWKEDYEENDLFLIMVRRLLASQSRNYQTTWYEWSKWTERGLLQSMKIVLLQSLYQNFFSPTSHFPNFILLAILPLLCPMDCFHTINGSITEWWNHFILSFYYYYYYCYYYHSIIIIIVLKLYYTPRFLLLFRLEVYL